MFGIGYEGLSLDGLIAKLRLRDADVLVDIRLNALSRKQGYSKRALGAALEAAGITYLHEPRLGNPRENRAGYAETSTPAGEAARDQFRELLSSPDAAAAIREVADLAETHTVALLCYEADETHCHREQVLAAVREARQSVVHV